MQTPTGYGQTPPPNPSYSPSVPLHVYRELATQLQAVEAKLDVVTAHNQKLAQENQLLRHEIARVAQAFEQLQKLADSSSIPYAPPKPRPSTEVNNTSPEPRPNTEVRNTPPEPQPRPNAEVRNIPQQPRTTAEVKNVPKPPRQAVIRSRSKTKSQLPPKQPRREEYLEPGVEVNYPTTPRPHPREAPANKHRQQEFLVEPMVEVAYPISETAYIEEEEIRYYTAPEESELKEMSSWWLLIMIVLIILTGFSAGYFFVRPFFQPQGR